MANTGTPRPLPKFFVESQTFSTKKARGGTPRDCAPPRPPMKSAPPISRIHQHRPVTHAQLVSFKTNHNNNSLQSLRLYNEKSKDLYFDQCFTVEARIGCGSFGEVFKVRSKETGNYYAVKRSRERFRGETDRRRKMEEVAKHEQLPKHPNCVRYYQAWEERQHLYIQTELCEMSLSTFSEAHHDIPEKIIWNYLVDLLMAVKHLHDHDLVHMDIKPDNIFISEDGTCKLGDFGLVLEVTKVLNDAEVQEGDPRYMAPELLQGRFTKIADIFSLGMTILELACDLDLPKGGEGWHLLRTKQLPQEFVKNLSDDLRAVICLMIEPDPLLRPNADMLLQLRAVKNVWRKRRYHQMYRSMVSCMSAVVGILVGVLLSIWLFLTKPLHHLIPDRLCSTPNKPQSTNLTNTWEHSFSDDEFGDDDSINLSNNSMGIPLDTSTSSELDLSHDSNSFKVPSIPARKALTTPRRRRPLGPKNSSPIMNLLSSFNSGTSGVEFVELLGRFRSPDEKIISFHSDSSPSHTPENSFTDDMEEPKPPRTPIGPKNLIKVFDAADDL